MKILEYWIIINKNFYAKFEEILFFRAGLLRLQNTVTTNFWKTLLTWEKKYQVIKKVVKNYQVKIVVLKTWKSQGE